MIKFNWEQVKRICNYEPVSILQYFCFREGIWLPNYLPKNYSKKMYHSATRDGYPYGDSYILNIKPILINTGNYFLTDIYDYIRMASARNYFDYKVRGIKTLPLIIAKANRMELINPLIEVIDNNIHFKYETEINREVKHGH
jgi:hypothetical protein